MNESGVRTVVERSRHCAQVIFETTTYLQSELANVRISDELRAQAERVCQALIGTKYEITSELSELEECLVSGASARVIDARVSRLLWWLQEGNTRLQELSNALESASESEPAYRIAYILVAETAVDIENASNPIRVVAEALRSESGDTG